MMRLYSNVAQDTVLTADPGVSGLTLSVVDTTGWPSPPSGDTALVCLDFGMGTVELAEYTSKTATSFTLSARGVDGTTAQVHNVGAVVRHVASASDFEAFVRYGASGNSSLQAALWYPPAGVGSIGAVAASASVLREAQFLVPTRTRFLGIGIEVTVAGAGNLRLGIYADNGAGKPAALIADFGTVSGATTGFKSITIDVWLPRGAYHLALLSETVSITTRVIGTHVPPIRLPAISTTSTSVSGGYQATGVAAGGLPSPFPVGMALSVNMPHVLLLTA